MENNQKNGFFSWLSASIRKKKTIDVKKEHELKENKENLTLSTVQVIKNNKDILNDVNNIKNTEKNFFSKLKKKLTKTKKFLGDGISRLFLSKKIDHVLFEELEEKMLLADIGIHTTDRIIKQLINDIDRNDLKSSEKVYHSLKRNMHDILKKVEIPLIPSDHTPFIILVVGVNGAGKTTTVAKLAKKYKLQGKSVMLAAADTFRAGGVEQLQILGKLNKIPVIAQVSGTDPAAVIFDAVKSSISKKIDVLIIDTAGRLHNKSFLIEELKKIVRVIKKLDISAPHEIMLIIDACNGQNTIQQTEIFHQALNVTGIVITKLDGTAKGGVIFALSDQFSIPIRYIGIGEKTKDLGTFNSQAFIEAIFDHKNIF